MKKLTLLYLAICFCLIKSIGQLSVSPPPSKMIQYVVNPWDSLYKDFVKYYKILDEMAASSEFAFTNLDSVYVLAQIDTSNIFFLSFVKKVIPGIQIIQMNYSGYRFATSYFVFVYIDPTAEEPAEIDIRKQIIKAGKIVEKIKEQKIKAFQTKIPVRKTGIFINFM